jgi:hypothetical protein
MVGKKYARITATRIRYHRREDRGSSMDIFTAVVNSEIINPGAL